MVPATNLIKGPFTVYARGWAGKNEGWATSNSGQSEGGGGGGPKKLPPKRGMGLPDFLFLFYFQTNTFRALGTNGTRFASLLKYNCSLLAVFKLIKKTVTISAK